MTEDKKPAPKKTRPSKPKSEKVVAPKVEVEAEKKVEAPAEEKPKTEVVKQPDPPVAEAKLPKNEGHPPVNIKPEPGVEQVLQATGIRQTLYGAGKIKRRLRTRKARYE